MKIAQYIGKGIFSGFSQGAAELSLGGRETAAVRLGQQWAKLGHDVTTFVPIDRGWVEREPSGGVHTYVNAELGVPMLSHTAWDLVVLWEEPGVVLVPGVRENAEKIVVAMQVAHIDCVPEMDELIDAWQVLSPWAGRFLREQLPYVDEDKVVVLPNAVDTGLYGAPLLKRERPRKKPKFTYASSPDRGLRRLLQLWPRLREEFPGCTLDVAYGLESWVESVRWAHVIQTEHALEILERLEEYRSQGVRSLGKVSQKVLAGIHRDADALLYPCDVLSPTETGCITVMESLAGGSPVVTTDADCLAEEFWDVAHIVPRPFANEQFVERVKYAMVPGRWEHDRRRGRHWVMRERTWEVVAPRWIETFSDARQGEIMHAAD